MMTASFIFVFCLLLLPTAYFLLSWPRHARPVGGLINLR